MILFWGFLLYIFLRKCNMTKLQSLEINLFFAGRGVKFSRFQMPALISWRLSRFYSAHPISKSYRSVLFCCKLLCHPPPPHIVQPVCAICRLSALFCGQSLLACSVDLSLPAFVYICVFPRAMATQLLSLVPWIVHLSHPPWRQLFRLHSTDCL